jgi:hypothetical protein
MVAVEKNIRTNLSARTSVLLQRYLLCRMQNKVSYFFDVLSSCYVVLKQKIEVISYDFNSLKKNNNCNVLNLNVYPTK